MLTLRRFGHRFFALVGILNETLSFVEQHTNQNWLTYFFFLPFFLEVFFEFFLALIFLEVFLPFLSDLTLPLTFFFDLGGDLAAFFFGFEAFFLALGLELAAAFSGFDFEAFFFDFGFAVEAVFLTVGTSFFAAAIVALARTGPKPETVLKDSTVLDAIFSAERNPLALSVSAVDRPMPDILVTGVGI